MNSPLDDVCRMVLGAVVHDEVVFTIYRIALEQGDIVLYTRYVTKQGETVTVDVNSETRIFGTDGVVVWEEPRRSPEPEMHLAADGGTLWLEQRIDIMSSTRRPNG